MSRDYRGHDCQERSDGHRYQQGFHSAISCSYAPAGVVSLADKDFLKPRHDGRRLATPVGVLTGESQERYSRAVPTWPGSSFNSEQTMSTRNPDTPSLVG